MVHSEEELKMLVTASQEAGVLEEDEEQMLHRVFGFGDLTAGQVMVPRTELTGDPERRSPGRGGRRRSPNSRSHGCPSSARARTTSSASCTWRTSSRRSGSPPETFQVRTYLREAMTVPETLKADEVLDEMKRHRTHHAVVIDEYGGTAGLITFEGLMERIVGEVGSEARPASRKVTVLADGSALIDGLALATDINEQFGLHIDEDIYNTVGGFVLGQLGRRARVGDRIEVEGRMIRVEALDGLRVARVYLSAPGRQNAPRLSAEQARDGLERSPPPAEQPASGGQRVTPNASSRSPFPITRSEAPMSATTAIHSVAAPATARTRNSAFSPSAIATFTWMLRRVRRPRRSRYGSFSRSSDISATSAVSSAASDPAAPIAMPTSAAASAGASFTPSPTIATVP